MLFSSNVFLFRFLPVVLAGYYILFRGMRRQQNLFLLLSSLFFYAWGEWRSDTSSATLSYLLTP